MIRWKKRLHGWAMFRGTSRKASAWVRVHHYPEGHRTVVAEVSTFKCWLRPKTIAAAKAWCEAAAPHGWDHFIELPTAIIVMPDGRVEYRALERQSPDLLYQVFPPTSQHADPSQYVKVEEIRLRGRRFGVAGADPNSGQYIKWEVTAYSSPQHEHIAEELACAQLEDVRRKHFYRSMAKSPSFTTGAPGLDIWRTT